MHRLPHACWHAAGMLLTCCCPVLPCVQVSGNELMDKSWQKLLVNMMKGKGSTAQQARM